jgi:hypothetical protein
LDQPFLLSQKKKTQLIFFPAKFFSNILEKGNLSMQKKIFWREKN